MDAKRLPERVVGLPGMGVGSRVVATSTIKRMRALLSGWVPWLLSAWLLATPGVQAVVATRLPETALISGVAVGASSRSYEPLTVHESLDQIRQAGAHLVELHFGQVLTPSDREAVLNDAMSEDQVAALRQKVSSSGVRLASARVRFSQNPSANQRLFEWASRLEIQVLVGDVPEEQFDHLERMIRRFNIAVGLASVSRGAGGTKGAWTDPRAVMRMLRGRDARLGVVLNVPGLVRAGVDPFQAIQDLRTRLHGVQVGDFRSAGSQVTPVPFGTGQFDFHRLLMALDSQRFDGYVVFEWPTDGDGFREELARGVSFVRQEMSAIRRANLLRLASREATVREGLEYEVLVQGTLPEPMAIQPVPGGGLWLAGRRGDVWSWKPGDRTNGVVAALPVSVTGQRGIHGFVFDPGFATNRQVYVYRSPMLPEGNSNRVSRFTLTDSADGGGPRIAVESEQVLLDIPSTHHGQTQGGGFLLNPRDGCLYIGTGDNRRPEETPRFYDDPNVSPQDPGDLRGKILRIRTDGSIPPDNPMVAVQGARPEVYALGLRNPFSLSLDSVTGNIYIGDIGYSRREDWEEVNLLRAGANYGWPRCDGRHRDTLAATPCPLGDAVGPWFGYPHDSAAAVLVGPFISGGPPPGWPALFAHGLVYADFSRRSIRFAQVDAQSNRVTNTVPIASGLAGGPLGMVLGPEGDLFLVEYAGWLSAHHQDRLSRIRPASGTRVAGGGRQGSGAGGGEADKDPAGKLVK